MDTLSRSATSRLVVDVDASSARRVARAPFAIARRAPTRATPRDAARDAERDDAGAIATRFSAFQ
jgi:hypothetical protein